VTRPCGPCLTWGGGQKKKWVRLVSLLPSDLSVDGRECWPRKESDHPKRHSAKTTVGEKQYKGMLRQLH